MRKEPTRKPARIIIGYTRDLAAHERELQNCIKLVAKRIRGLAIEIVGQESLTSDGKTANDIVEGCFRIMSGGNARVDSERLIEELETQVCHDSSPYVLTIIFTKQPFKQVDDEFFENHGKWSGVITLCDCLSDMSIQERGEYYFLHTLVHVLISHAHCNSHPSCVMRSPHDEWQYRAFNRAKADLIENANPWSLDGIFCPKCIKAIEECPLLGEEQSTITYAPSVMRYK